MSENKARENDRSHLGTKVKISMRERWLPITIVLLVMLPLLMRRLGDSSLGYPDAAAQLMDGVFLLDFLRELPLTKIYDFTINYYGQYPSLSIGYRPPFFPLVEALFNGAFGINMWSSRLAILSFALVGVTAWYKLVSRIFDRTTAFWTCLLLVTTPFVARWGWYTMGEIPVLSMVMIAAYVFYLYIDTDCVRYLYASAFLFSLAAWTKQTAIFMAIWFFLYLLVRGKLWAYFKRREIYGAMLLILVLLTPLLLITLWLGEQNLAGAIGEGESAGLGQRFGWENLTAHIVFLVNVHITHFVFVFSLIGLGWSACKKDARVLYFLFLIVGTYIFFWYISNNDDRYAIFWIPAFSLFAALPLYYMKKAKKAYIAGMVLLAIVCVHQVSIVYARKMDYATGYDQAARYILKNKNSPLVFFDGYNHGYFTYFMRAFDNDKSMFVLRGDKLLSSSSIGATNRLQVHANSREEIKKIFDQYGIADIVIEKEDRSTIPIHGELRDFLKTGPFDLVKKIPVRSNRKKLEGQVLMIYKYREAKPITADVLELRIPAVGKTIKIKLQESVKKQAGKS